MGSQTEGVENYGSFFFFCTKTNLFSSFKTMTLKEAILKSLDELNKLTNYNEVTSHLIKNNYYDFKEAKTPPATVSALLGDFIRLGDTRIKRIKKSGGYLYYLAKNEKNIGIEVLVGTADMQAERIEKISKKQVYHERDLHKLLSTYLKSIDIYSKTVFHEQSNGVDNNQIWTHPDMVGIRFLNLQSKVSANFLKAINRVDTFKLSSYEIKKEINNDSELKKAFFQAVSNSSWANYGYLVAFELSDSLNEEMERLNQSFGIGVIEIKANPFQSRVLFQPKYRELDYKTIDKLCKMNKDFEKFIEQTEKLLTAEERYYKATEKELSEFCDSYFINDAEIEKYCREKFIPLDDKDFVPL